MCFELLKTTFYRVVPQHLKPFSLYQMVLVKHPIVTFWPHNNGPIRQGAISGFLVRVRNGLVGSYQ